MQANWENITDFDIDVVSNVIINVFIISVVIYEQKI